MSETKQLMDAFKAADEVVGLFKEARDKMLPIQELFIEATRGKDHTKWLTAINAVIDLDEDTAKGALIVLMGVMARVRVGLEGTECYDKVKELFTPKES